MTEKEVLIELIRVEGHCVGTAFDCNVCPLLTAGANCMGVLYAHSKSSEVAKSKHIVALQKYLESNYDKVDIVEFLL